MHDLDTRFFSVRKKMELKELDAHIGNSHLKDEVIFYYNRSGELGDFNHKIRMKGHLVGSRVDSQDLGLFQVMLTGCMKPGRYRAISMGRSMILCFPIPTCILEKTAGWLAILASKGCLRSKACKWISGCRFPKSIRSTWCSIIPNGTCTQSAKVRTDACWMAHFKGTLEDFAVNASASSDGRTVG
jgi:hypothetical protein